MERSRSLSYHPNVDRCGGRGGAVIKKREPRRLYAVASGAAMLRAVNRYVDLWTVGTAHFLRTVRARSSPDNKSGENS